MAVRFEWDAHKAALNVRKHGVGFDVAALAFADPFTLIEQDRVEGGELRWRTLDMAQGGAAALGRAYRPRRGRRRSHPHHLGPPRDAA